MEDEDIQKTVNKNNFFKKEKTLIIIIQASFTEGRR